MDMAVLPFFDLTRKSAPCNIRNLTQVRWPFLAARCSGVQPDISASSTSPSCWMRSFSTSKCPFADALCNAVDPDSSNALGLWPFSSAWVASLKSPVNAGFHNKTRSKGQRLDKNI